MTLKECYQILKVDQSASLEDVKRAYRRRAFELHPDLNPHVRDASRQFQLLNEAYVILTRLVAAREAAEQRRQEQPQEQSFASRWNSWSFSFGGKKTEQPDADAKNESKAENSEERRAEREEAYREEMRREEARRRDEKIRVMREEEAKRERDRQIRKEQAEQNRQEKERQERERLEKERREQERLEKERIEQERIEQERSEKERQAPRRDIPPRPGSVGSGTTASDTAGSTAEASAPPPRPPRPGSDENLYAEQQEVLRDILNDSFARRVFEDIYSEIRKKGPQPEHNEAPRPEAARKETTRERTVLRPNAVSAPPPATPKSGFSFGLEQFGLDFSKGMGNTVKGWLRSQIDEEQTIRLPATGLFPGARVRLQIRRGLSDDLTTLEVVLPTDFVVGKPIRLRGMGKRLGSVQGDLYLTVLSR